jgi:curved DNA-binding protein CbpA
LFSSSHHLLVPFPDKNIDNVEEAKLMFQSIKNAYGVLSDPQERAWYDSHKDSILRGGDGTLGSEDEEDDDETNLWPFFQTSCFKGFGKKFGDEDFYKVPLLSSLLFSSFPLPLLYVFVSVLVLVLVFLACFLLLHAYLYFFSQVYNDLFQQLDEEEEQNELEHEYHVPAPSFGDEDTTYNEGMFSHPSSSSPSHSPFILRLLTFDSRLLHPH